MKSKMIKIAFSSHKKCFICRCSVRSLHSIKKESIIKIYQTVKILIKNDSRCCSRHLDSFGLVKREHFSLIPSESKNCTKEQMETIQRIVKKSETTGIFDYFRDISTLDEDLCKKITNWSRSEFMKFSSYIISLNDSNGRTKEQLIAIYRFWLRKGIDQSSIALLKINTSQQQISHYLSQIRQSIYKDFVPLFLGANKKRSLFLEHNTKSAACLFNMKKSDLAIVADATYCRIEKSANNQFQYLCWSEQKTDLLIKPFLLCCADGYIIDCYGPFQANRNDAQILDFVLKNDENLKNILLPNKTFVFLDRGKCEMILSRISNL